jgi:hypothetical protein
VFTIIITACYTGSIIAFVTLPVFPETVDKISTLNERFYKIGTLDRGGWERWFLNSTDSTTERLIRRLEFTRNIQEGLGNVTKPFFLFPYAFIGSKAQLDYIIQTNYTNDKLSRRSTLHVSDQCFVMFGVSFAFQPKSVYRDKINNGILELQQSGLLDKIKRDVRWDMYRSAFGTHLQISPGKTFIVRSQEERGLTLADTEGMFLLLGMGFLIAAGALLSEWVGGCTNKCVRIVKLRRQKSHEHDEKDVEILDENSNRSQISSKSSSIDFTRNHDENDKNSSRSKSEASVTCINDISPSMLRELYEGPKNTNSNIVMFDGKLMTERDAGKSSSLSREAMEKFDDDYETKVTESFDFLNSHDNLSTTDDDEDYSKMPQAIKVEINAATPVREANEKDEYNQDVDLEDIFGERINV